ncbi:MAG: Type IV secretion system protein virB4 [Legionellaceae bacterium]
MHLINKLKKKWSSSPKPKSLVTMDNEIGMSRHIPITHLVSPSVFMTKNNELGAVINVSGNSFMVKDNSELARLQANLAFFIKGLHENYGIYVTTHRYLKPTRLKGNTKEGFSHDFYEAYHQKFEHATLYVTDLYVTLLLRCPQKEGKKRTLNERIKSLAYTASKTAFSERLNKQLSEFTAMLQQLMTTLSGYTPRLLGEEKDVQEKAYPELLSFFSLLINGEKRDFSYPWQSIAKTLPFKRLFFNHDTLHFQGNTQKEDVFGAMLSIRDYCSETYPGKLDELLKVPCSFIATHSFLGISKNASLQLIKEQQNRFTSTEDAAFSQIDELSSASDDVASDKISLGYHHNTVLILSKTLSALSENVSRISDIYAQEKMVAVRETINLQNAFFAQIPGNARFIRRASLISNHNVTCFAPLHNYYTGYYNKNHLGSALLLAETPSKTPFYFNLHEKSSGNKNDLSKGHTLLIGPSNAGKTVIMTTIDAMMQKYRIRSFLFDRDNGMEIYVNAMKGRYYRLTPDEPTGFNPCQLPDTGKNRAFLTQLIELLCTDLTPLTAEDRHQISDVVNRNYSLPFEKRNLSTISYFFSVDFKGLSALSRWLSIPDYAGRVGEFAWIFDNPSDTFTVDTHDTFGFDMTYLLSSKSESRDQLLPVMHYLFHRIEGSLEKNRLTGVYLDEGWQTLAHPYFIEKIATYLATWRKSNAFLFFATQLPETIATSPLAPAFMSNTATKLYLANPEASEKTYRDDLKLTLREFEIIRSLSPDKRYFLIKQSHEAAVVRLPLYGLEKYIRVLSGTLDTVDICRRLIQEVGNTPEKWLPLFYQEIGV